MQRQEVRRSEDGELLGYVLAEGDRWRPVTVFLGALGPSASLETALAAVHDRGLSALAEPWWCRLTDGGPWQPCRLLEVRPDEVRLRLEDPMADQPPGGIVLRPVSPQTLRSTRPGGC